MLSEELARMGTHFHQGEIVVYEIIRGCPHEYRENDVCPACQKVHRCGNGC